MRTLLVTAMLSLLPSMAAGEPKVEQIVLANGRALQAEVVELGDDTIVLRLPEYGDARLVVSLDRVSDYSLFELKRARIEPTSASDREALGDWALDRGLFAFAMMEYRRAIELTEEEVSDALRRKTAEADSKCGRDKLERASELHSAGELRRARSFLRDLLNQHPECPAVPEARKRLAKVEKEMKSAAAGAREAKDRRSDERTEKAVKERIRERLDRAAVLDDLALRSSGSYGRAEDYYEAAIHELERARAVLDRLRESDGSESELEPELEELAETISKRLVAAHVAIGHNFVVKGNLVKARGHMGRALALDPNDPEALKLRTVISQAAGSDERRSGGR